MQEKKVLFLGPIPPPVHGFSAINAAMLDLLLEKNPTQIFNRAPPINKKNNLPKKTIYSFICWIKLIFCFFIAATQHPKSLYAGFSGGKGQILDLPFFIIARLFKIPIYIHHHSFAYLNQPSRLTAACMSILKHSHHIVLCQEMAHTLASTYKISKFKINVLSNAAFLPEIDNTRNKRKNPAECGEVKIGFLSNITEEKGIFDFFSVLRRASEIGIPYQAEIAGPVEPSILKRFQDELSQIPNVKHLGPLYGPDKQHFFQTIDLFLFPTRYANEAEPVTLHEALQAGATVVAIQRGCIGGMLPDHCGSAQPSEAFEKISLEKLKELIELSPAQRLTKRAKIFDHYQKTAKNNKEILQKILKEICQISPTQKTNL